MPENDPPHAFLEAARSAVDRGQTGEAQEALERAETRLLDRAVGLNSAQEPDDRRAVLDIGVARQALAAGDRPGTLRAIDDALAAPYLVARRAPPLPATPYPVADFTLPSPRPPSVTYALLPGHWQLEGARYIWMPPETALRRVELGPSSRVDMSGATGNGGGCLHIMKTTEMGGRYGAAASRQRRSSRAPRN